MEKQVSQGMSLWLTRNTQLKRKVIIFLFYLNVWDLTSALTILCAWVGCVCVCVYRLDSPPRCEHKAIFIFAHKFETYEFSSSKTMKWSIINRLTVGALLGMFVLVNILNLILVYSKLPGARICKCLSHHIDLRKLNKIQTIHR